MNMGGRRTENRGQGLQPLTLAGIPFRLCWRTTRRDDVAIDRTGIDSVQMPHALGERSLTRFFPFAFPFYGANGAYAFGEH